MGHQETTADSDPTVLPELQHKGVISVVLGDYHFGALTVTGKLLTWGTKLHDCDIYRTDGFQVNTPKEPWDSGIPQTSNPVNQVVF
jgi:hypothetical protein